jgi:hypothetical protein
MSVAQPTMRGFAALLCAFLFSAMVAACGGGGGGSVAGGGIGGTGITNGTITGFGSVIVNGQKFEVVNGRTQITIDGNASGTQTQLQLGMIVAVQYTQESGQLVADKIDYRSDVKGPVTVNAAASTLQVLNQTVLIDNQTCVQITGDSNECVTGAAGLAALASGDSVEVCGNRDDQGQLRATRVRKKTSTELEIRGQIQSGSLTATTFIVNGLTVNYASAQANGKVTGTLANGATVEVKASSAPVGNVLTATEVKVESSGGGSAGTTVEIENLITRFASSPDFDVGTQKVQATGTTVYENGAASNLAANIKVKVKGKLNGSNVLVADLISFRPTIEIEASVSTTPASSTLTLLGSPGVLVRANALTTFKDNRDSVPGFGFGNIAQGDFLKILAQPSGSEIVATRVERIQAQNKVELRGVASAKTATSITILGITVQTSGATQFKSELDGSVDTQSEFFAALTAGQSVVKASGTFSPQTINADEVEIELPD